MTQKVNEIIDKIDAIVKPYRDLARSYWESEDRLLENVDENGIKRTFFSEIIHSGPEVLGSKILEKLSSKGMFSKFLFGSPNAFYDAVREDRINSPLELTTINRIKFMVKHWQSSDFSSLKIPIKLSDYELHQLKMAIVENIDRWILSNPYKNDISSPSYYVAEDFVKYGRHYTQSDLIPDFQLTNNLVFAAMERQYIKFKKDNPHTSITEIPKTIFTPSIEKIKGDFGIGRNLIQSLTQKKVTFYSKETLQSLLQTITKWHIDEFGQRDSGLAYYGRIQDKLSYDKSDPDVQSLLYYYSNALDSINKYAELRGIELNSPTKSHIALSEMISSKNELVMNEYQIKVWDDDMTKAYHIIYHLSKYLGFDPITFTPLDDNIFEPSTGDYRRHHFLALMFRKMTSHIDDVMLTSNELHIKHYETPLRNKGLDMEIYVKQVMKSLVQLIEMRDGSGNYMKIKEEHMRKVLYKNFGEVAGEKVLEKWKKQGDFMKSLGAFNDRRLKAFNGDYKQFLIDDYKNAYSAHFNRISKITYTKILTTQDNLDYLNAIYGLKLTLRPISKKLEDLY